MNIGVRIRTALNMRNVKQKDLAKHLNVTDNTISYFCGGQRIPNINQIIKIAEYLGVSVDYLLGTNTNTTVDFTELKSLIADINTTEIASHLNNMDEWTAKWRAEAEKALYKISEDYLK